MDDGIDPWKRPLKWILTETIALILTPILRRVGTRSAFIAMDKDGDGYVTSLEYLKFKNRNYFCPKSRAAQRGSDRIVGR